MEVTLDKLDSNNINTWNWYSGIANNNNDNPNESVNDVYA